MMKRKLDIFCTQNDTFSWPLNSRRLNPPIFDEILPPANDIYSLNLRSQSICFPRISIEDIAPCSKAKIIITPIPNNTGEISIQSSQCISPRELPSMVIRPDYSAQKNTPIIMPHLTPEILRNYTVKGLRNLCAERMIVTKKCFLKQELINLLLRHNGESQSGYVYIPEIRPNVSLLPDIDL